MSRYTLKSYSGAKLVEKYEHRTVGKLYTILNQPRHHNADHTGPFGEILEHVNKFEIYECSQMHRLFSGNVTEALNFLNTL
jgi:hypothetical protein